MQRYLVVLLIGGVVFLQPVGQRPIFEGSCDSMLHLDLPQCVGVRNHLHHSWEQLTSQSDLRTSGLNGVNVRVHRPHPVLCP